MINENDTSNVENLEGCTSKDINFLINEIDCIKKAQTVMSNKLDLIIEKLNNESSSSNNNSITSCTVSNSNSNNLNQLTGAKKRKFNNSNNKANTFLIDSENLNNNNNNNQNYEERDEFDVINQHNSRSNNRQSEIYSTISNNEIEIDEIKIEKNNEIFNKNVNENSSKFNNPKISNNNNNYNDNNNASVASNQQSQPFFDIDVAELLNEPHIARNLHLSNYIDFKPPIYKMNDLYYVNDDLSMAAYSKSKSRRNFAAHLTRLVFTPRERLESNCNGRNGKHKLDPVRLQVIRNTIFKYYPCKQSTLVLDGDTISTGDSDENTVWYRDCAQAIDESNRVLKKQVIAWHKKYLNSKNNRYSNISNPTMNYNQSFNNINNSNNNEPSTSSVLPNTSIMSNTFLNNNQNSNNNFNYLSDDNSNNNNSYQYDCEDGFDDIYD